MAHSEADSGTVVEMKFSEGKKVCVVGAGISGVSSAIRLQEKGYEVTVYERLDRIGGKCYTRDLVIDGRTLSFELGASVVAINYRSLLRFARMLRERTSSVNPYKILQESGEIVTFRQHYWPKGKTLALIYQFLKCAFHMMRFYRKYVSSTGYRDNIPDEYLVPFSQYFETHRMKDLMAWFELPLSAWGYGDPKTIPVWYVFGEINVMALIGVLVTVTFGKSQFVKGLKHGYGNLVRRLAEREGLNVQTGTDVRAIFRRSDGVSVETQQGVEEFDYVVISSPQAGNLLADPSEDESAFLRDLVYAPYSTTLCTLDKSVGAKLIVAQSLQKTNAVRMVAAPYENCAVAVCYARIDAKKTESEVREMVSRELESLAMGAVEIHEVCLWQYYFPHFATYEGYKSLLASQGQNRTVFVGVINKFEFVEAAIDSSIDLVDLYFAGPTRPRSEFLTAIRNVIFMFK